MRDAEVPVWCLRGAYAVLPSFARRFWLCFLTLLALLCFFMKSLSAALRRFPPMLCPSGTGNGSLQCNAAVGTCPRAAVDMLRATRVLQMLRRAATHGQTRTGAPARGDGANCQGCHTVVLASVNGGYCICVMYATHCLGSPLGSLALQAWVGINEDARIAQERQHGFVVPEALVRND